MESTCEQPIATPRQAVGQILDDTGILTIDALFVAHEIWLVPSWFEAPDGKSMWPERAIRVDLFGAQRGTFAGYDFFLPQPIPTAVLAGRARHAQGVAYTVLDLPSHLTWSVPVRMAT